MSGPHNSPWERPRPGDQNAERPTYGTPPPPQNRPPQYGMPPQPGHGPRYGVPPQPTGPQFGGPAGPRFGSPGPVGPGPGGPKEPNALGIAALAVAVLGTILACIPGIMWLGWILLAIALVLGLVAVTTGDKPKGFGFAGIGVTIFGTVVAMIAFVVVSGPALSGLFDSDNETIFATGETDQDVAIGESEESGSADSPATPVPLDSSGSNRGSSDSAHDRENPAGLGDTVSVDGWDIVVNSLTRDATAVVMDENPFNDPPPVGTEYALVNVKVTYTGDDMGMAFLTGVAFVADDGTVINWFDNAVVVPDRLDGELYTGASTTGNVALAIPRTADGLIRVGMAGLSGTAFIDPN